MLQEATVTAIKNLMNRRSCKDFRARAVLDRKRWKCCNLRDL